MGWASAYEIMDAAIEAADAMLADFSSMKHLDDVNAALVRERFDEAIRPYVRIIADKLRDQDWDTINDSQYFDRFMQEMLGHGDQEHLKWLREQVVESDADPEWIGKYQAFQAKLAAKGADPLVPMYWEGHLADAPIGVRVIFKQHGFPLVFRVTGHENGGTQLEQEKEGE